MHRGTCFDEHFAVQTSHPPLVLVFDVALRRIPAHSDRDAVRTANQRRCDVVLAGKTTVGSVTDEVTVDPHRVHALGTTDVQDDRVAGLGTWCVKGRAVHHGWNFLGQLRRRNIGAPRHRDVRVVRQVAQAEQGPVARNGNSLPFRIVNGADRGCGHMVGMQPTRHCPLTIQRNTSARRRSESRPHRQSIDRHHLGVGPRPCVSDVRKAHDTEWLTERRGSSCACRVRQARGTHRRFRRGPRDR